MPQAFPNKYTNQAVGQPGLQNEPGEKLQGNPSAKGFIEGGLRRHPHGGLERHGAEGSDVTNEIVPNTPTVVTELTDPSCYQQQGGGPLETKQGEY